VLETCKRNVACKKRIVTGEKRNVACKKREAGVVIRIGVCTYHRNFVLCSIIIQTFSGFAVYIIHGFLL
jgi:hypothetical protein